MTNWNKGISSRSVRRQREVDDSTREASAHADAVRMLVHEDLATGIDFGSALERVERWQRSGGPRVAEVIRVLGLTRAAEVYATEKAARALCKEDR